MLHKCKINIEITYFFQCENKCTTAANEFLLHKCRNNRKTEKYIFFFKSEKMHKSFLMKKCSSPSNEFLLHR